MAVCGLPGIRRSVICDLGRLEKCVEKPVAITYSASFAEGENGFSMTVDPDTGEKFSRYLAVMNGLEDEFDAVGYGADNGIWNPTLIRNKRRANLAKERRKNERTVKEPAGNRDNIQRCRGYIVIAEQLSNCFCTVPEVVGLFHSVTGNAKSKTATNGVAGNDRLLILQITDKFLAVFLGFYAIRGQFHQILDSSCYVSNPQNIHEIPHDLIAHLLVGLSAFERHTQRFIAMLP